MLKPSEQVDIIEEGIEIYNDLVWLLYTFGIQSCAQEEDFGVLWAYMEHHLLRVENTDSIP